MISLSTYIYINTYLAYIFYITDLLYKFIYIYIYVYVYVYEYISRERDIERERKNMFVMYIFDICTV